jgi:hypothetical protein
VGGVHPYSLRNTKINPLARLLPLKGQQADVYRFGERHPPVGDLAGMGPTWEACSFVINALGTARVRVNLQREFTLLAISTSATSVAAGGFRAQLYDQIKKRSLMDRGVQQALMAGNMGTNPLAPFFLREPYCFDQPDSQVVVLVQNVEAVQNSIQIVLYGLARRFNEPGGVVFPGGPIPSRGIR